MVKMTLDVDGMACGMCEAHVNDAVDEEKLKSAIEATGYTVLGIKIEPYEKKKFSLFHRG